MDKNQIREVIARRAALELRDGDVVNLGIGLPTMIPDFLPEGVSVILQSENGLVGMGPTPKEGEEDKNLQAGYISLIGLARNILETCIHILGFSAPEKM